MVVLEKLTCSAEETERVANNFAETFKGGELVILKGGLGAGKTTFTRGLANGVGIDPAEVSSPSYTIINMYEGSGLNMIHADLYRLGSSADINDLAIDDFLDDKTVLVVEWGENLPDLDLEEYLVSFEILSDDKCKITVEKMN